MLVTGQRWSVHVSVDKSEARIGRNDQSEGGTGDLVWSGHS